MLFLQTQDIFFPYTIRDVPHLTAHPYTWSLQEAATMCNLDGAHRLLFKDLN